ncbi:hypothetical protein NST94_25920 [Paenibacillus sp. FSL H8-0282]|uniref:hypothetical protein n=1 Tax=Paenibacillus sp. FSL H8-0282 TaxID=2954741 RepID=UPI0030DD8A89
MNMMILLFGLLFPYFDASPQLGPISTFIEQPKSVLAFEHASASSPYINHFDSLQGVALYTTKEELLLTKGNPLAVTNDPLLETVEYHYADVTVGVGEGVVLYVHVAPPQAQQFGLHVDGVEIDPLTDNLQDTLGKPYFIAEDGDVYLRGNNALKIYRNLAGEFEGIDLFDSISS